ncbi:MAG: LysE family transporter [Moorellales bacterium]
MGAIVGLLVASWVVSLSGALMPGPLLTVTINQSLHRGVSAGPLVVLGHALLELALVLVLLSGLQSLLAVPPVEMGLSLAGGAVLGYMSWGLLAVARKTPQPLPWERTGEERRSRRQAAGLAPIWAGIVTSVVNPYWELWWVSIGAAMLFQARGAGVAGVLAFYLGHILGDLGWYTAVAVAVVLGRRWLNRRAYSVLMAVCGLFLAAFALYFLYHGLEVGQRLGVWS